MLRLFHIFIYFLCRHIFYSLLFVFNFYLKFYFILFFLARGPGKNLPGALAPGAPPWLRLCVKIGQVTASWRMVCGRGGSELTKRKWQCGLISCIQGIAAATLH